VWHLLKVMVIPPNEAHVVGAQEAGVAPFVGIYALPVSIY